MSQFVQLMTEDFVKEAIQNPNKSYYCPELHAGNCNLKALSQFIEGCKNVSKMYLIVHLFPMILKRKKVKQNPVRQIKKFLVGFVKSLLFAGGYSAMVRRFICLLTQLFGYRTGHAYISGLLSGITLIFEPISRQSEITFYTVNKSTQVLYNMALRRGWKVRVPYGECWLNAVSLAVICFTYMNNPEVWRANYKRVLDNFLGQV